MIETTAYSSVLISRESAFSAALNETFVRSSSTEKDLPIPQNAGRGGFLGTDSDCFAGTEPFWDTPGISAVFFWGVFFFFIDIYTTFIFLSQQEMHNPLFFV